MKTPMMHDVLVVEVEPDLAATYERLLRRDDCRVLCTSSRASALEALAGNDHALVIADLRLPDGDGLDVVRAARALPNPPAVVVVTGAISAARRRAVRAAGAAAVLDKPFSTAAFRSLVRALLAPAS